MNSRRQYIALKMLLKEIMDTKHIIKAVINNTQTHGNYLKHKDENNVTWRKG